MDLIVWFTESAWKEKVRTETSNQGARKETGGDQAVHQSAQSESVYTV